MHKRLGVLSRTLALAVTLGGCGYTYHFQDGSSLRGTEHDTWASFFLFGLVGHHEVNVRDFCPNGVHEVTTGSNFLTWLVTGVTLGIYAPRKVNIWCSFERTAFAVEFDGEGRPTRVTKERDGVIASGRPRATEDGRWAVAWGTP